MNRMTRGLWFCLGLGLAIYFVQTLWLGFAGLVYPYQLVDGDGVVLWFTRQLAQGHAIYKGLTGFPYASSNYPPFGMFLAAALMPIFGDGYISGRLLHFASALIVAALIYRLVRLETRGKRWGALAALMFLGTPYIYHWVPQFRVDLIGLALAFGGVYTVWLWERLPSSLNRRQSPVTFPRLALSTVYCLLFTALLLLALYTKHSLLAAPAAVFLALWQRDRRQALAFALALGVSGGAMYWAIDSATGGGFTFGLIESNATLFLPDQLLGLLWDFVTTFPVLLLLALWGWLARVRAKRVGVLEWYAVTTAATLIMAGRTGAWENYFFEALAVACVFAGIAVASRQSSVNSLLALPQGRFAVRNSQFVLPILLLVQLALMWHDPRIAVNLMVQDYPANQQLAALLARTPGTVISEDIGALVTSGKGLAYYTFQYSSLARSGKWDQSWELNGMSNGLFPLVILEHGTREDVDHYQRFTRAFVSALDRYYARTQTIGKFEVYTPAPELHLQSANFGDAIGLVGWNAPTEIGKITSFDLSVVWQAQHVMNRCYTVFVQIENADGAKVTQDDREPRNGDYSTTRWAAGEMVRERYTLTLPDNLASGVYMLKVGWYDSETGDRLEVPRSSDNSFTVAVLEVK